jgi:CBS-domain-containing membrane protein
MGSGYPVCDRATVGSIMTPAVFTVRPDTPARKILEELVALRVHRLFVLDDDGVLVGVVSALDVMRGMLEHG